MKLDFSIDRSSIFHSRGSHAARRHVLQTWPIPEVNWTMSNVWNIFTSISMSRSSHLLTSSSPSSIFQICQNCFSGVLAYYWIKDKEKTVKRYLVLSFYLESLKKKPIHNIFIEDIPKIRQMQLVVTNARITEVLQIFSTQR